MSAAADAAGGEVRLVGQEMRLSAVCGGRSVSRSSVRAGGKHVECEMNISGREAAQVTHAILFLYNTHNMHLIDNTGM